MSSSVCQGLQSCLEPRLVEPGILMHKFSPAKSNSLHFLLQKPNLSQNQEKEENDYHNEEKNGSKFDSGSQKKGRNLNGRSFIQALTNTSDHMKQGTKTEQVYVHPLDKSSSCTLSTTSLEMCTESLGSETGSNISESFDGFQRNPSIQRSKPCEFVSKINRSVGFPPPLTSISGTEGVQVRPHREGGRLVIKAVAISSSSPCFQAERADGRLRLSFVKDRDLKQENEDQTQEEYDGDVDGGGGGVGDDCGGWEGGELKGNGGKVGVGEFQRRSRCKERGNENVSKGMPNWGAVWLAIS